MYYSNPMLENPLLDYAMLIDPKKYYLVIFISAKNLLAARFHFNIFLIKKF